MSQNSEEITVGSQYPGVLYLWIQPAEILSQTFFESMDAKPMDTEGRKSCHHLSDLNIPAFWYTWDLLNQSFHGY